MADANNAKVIEIVSSPESSPKPVTRALRRRRAQKRRARFIPAEDIIELSDSGADRSGRANPPPASPEEAEEPVAGPSRVSPVQVPLFLPDPDDDAQPGSSSKPVGDDDGHDPADRFVPIPASQPGSLLAGPVADEDPFDGFVAQVLEIIPDVLPAHARALAEKHFPAHKENVVGRVLHCLFEDPEYPRLDRKGKGKRKRRDGDEEERARASAKPKIDYGSTDREREGGEGYIDEALEQLFQDFPQIPVGHVRRMFERHAGFYAPTYLFLLEEQKEPRLPYRRKTAPSRRAGGKGKKTADAELEEEKGWLRLRLQGDAAERDAQVAQTNEEECGESGDGIECGCCFTTYAFDKMVQCPEAHLFCTACMTAYASTLLGAHDANIVCMDQSGCALPFPASELRRFLAPPLLALYERVKQRREIEAAGLANLEECPFCEYRCVIENDQEKLFRCENQDCMAVTCRECKKPDHLPKSCKEMEDDKKLDVRHAIEEAMTRALMRNCPKCQKAFVKEMGCNKMTCPQCGTLSCYVCRQIIRGYDHFGNPPPYNGRADPNKCQLWDPVENRHNEEVAAAAKKAMEELKAAHPDIDEADVKVDLPPPPAGGPSSANNRHFPLGLHAIPALPRVLVPPVPHGGFLHGRDLADVEAGLLRAQGMLGQAGAGAVYNVHVNIGGPPVLPFGNGMPVGPLYAPPVPMHAPAPAPRRPMRAVRASRRRR
ncbi:hypothetical protein AcW1_001960 [Taiwanofungus camphoratus]|nr:hypothetical protein AcW1_001960 [Antrodia cinnamomea]